MLVPDKTSGTRFLCSELGCIYMAQFWERYDRFGQLAGRWTWPGGWMSCYGLALATLFGTGVVTLLALRRHADSVAVLETVFGGGALYSLVTFLAVKGQ